MNYTPDTYFVVYNSKPIKSFIDYPPFIVTLEAGYFIVPYVTDYMKQVFKGSYLECLKVWSSISAFGIN